jgi:V/A-type H+-transporting ATPase subunit D
MAKIKFTKQELRHQQTRLSQLERYLPTLQLRKALLQSEVIKAHSLLEKLRHYSHHAWETLSQSTPLLGLFPVVEPEQLVEEGTIETEIENIAGVEIPRFKSLTFPPHEYDLVDTPPWLDSLSDEIRAFRAIEEKVRIAEKRIEILERELKEVFIRVNLFEKVLIPKCLRNIRIIKIFLGDLDLSAVSQAKKAKEKILARNKAREVPV